ncbi:DNA ligase [Stenotrophomonas daejeonensis]|uniref:DNA ligase n=1 Tax=Stenotrophomonas daejeonensis TaxID=659018 RepID=A0A0R0EBU3_9GAMM|nr:DNA ligase [Stenotrophomonas daejeonensis]KRG87795.1 DNA ligase [Stenotrophomonas daejeonensis]
MSRLTMLLCLLLLPLLATAAAPPPVMLAGQWHDGAEVSRYWVSEKLDGVRARWDGQALWTRAGNRIAAPAWFTRGWPRQALDGELWGGRGSFETTSGTVRSHPADDDGWRRLRFMAFDLPGHAGTFSQRLAAMQALVGSGTPATLAVIPQRRIADTAALHRHLQAIVAAGGEGLMLHHQDNRYGAGRSDGLLKLKPWDDAEARVVAHLPGKGKYGGMLGALLVERDDGARFRIGSGFKDAERAMPPAIGSLVTYRYNGLTAKGLPRFARFLRVRDEAPPPEPVRHAQ